MQTYKSAWQKLEQINNLLPYRLVEKRSGGSGGGGAVLTAEGKKLLRQVDALQEEFSQFMAFLTDAPHQARQRNIGDYQSIRCPSGYGMTAI